MTLVFAHDSRFLLEANGAVSSPAVFSQQIWQRYLKDFDEIRVLARLQNERGWEAPSSCEGVLAGKGVSVRFVPDVRTGLDFPVRQWRLQRIAAEEVTRADAVIGRLPSETGLAAIRSARRMGRPWAVEVAGCAWDGVWSYGGLAGKLYAPVMWYRVRRVVGRAPFALYVTDHFLQRRYPCRTGETVACSNVEIPTPSREVLDRRLASQSESAEGGNRELVFGLIGSLHGRFKGIQTVLEALGRIRGDLPPFRFRVLGVGHAGPWRELATRHGVEDVTSFDGTLSAGEPVLKWLDGIDVYLQPSLREGLPRALIEAMSRGCPAIGTRVAGIPELLEPDALVPRRDAEALGRLLVRSAHDADWRRRHALRNWEKAGEYSRDVLEPRRQAFWGRFADYARARSRG